MMKLIVMKLYSLAVNNNVICEVTMEVPHWLPVRPAIPRRWLRDLAAQALCEFFKRSPYLQCDDSTGSSIFN